MAASAKYIGGGSGTLDLDEAVFGESFHGPLVHEAVRAELAARRRGSPWTKTRAEVAMTGANAWRQKGTRRARVGTPSTKTAAQTLAGFDGEGSVLVVLADGEETCAKSFRNIADVSVLHVDDVG